MKRLLSGAWILAALLAGGCGGGAAEDPLLRLSAEESLVQGRQLFEQKEYRKARPFFEHAFEVEPNSVSGREALLLAADSLFLDGGHTNLLQAEAKYRDFLNRFPTSPRADYVQFQIGNCLAKRVERADRDQKTTRQAVEAFEELLRIYPTSEHAEAARQELARVKNSIAEHEFQVGHFYYRYGLPGAAVKRFEKLLEEFPDYPERDKVIYFLGQAFRKLDQDTEAQTTFERLRREFPQSRFVDDIPSSRG